MSGVKITSKCIEYDSWVLRGRRPQNNWSGISTYRSWVLRGELEENSKEILSVALLSPAYIYILWQRRIALNCLNSCLFILTVVLLLSFIQIFTNRLKSACLLWMLSSIYKISKIVLSPTLIVRKQVLFIVHFRLFPAIWSLSIKVVFHPIFKKLFFILVETKNILELWVNFCLKWTE